MAGWLISHPKTPSSWADTHGLCLFSAVYQATCKTTNFSAANPYFGGIGISANGQGQYTVNITQLFQWTTDVPTFDSYERVSTNPYKC